MTEDDGFCVGCDGKGGDCWAAKTNKMLLIACEVCDQPKFWTSGRLRAKCPKGHHLWHASEFKPK